MTDVGAGEHTGEKFRCAICRRPIAEGPAMIFPSKTGEWITHIRCGWLRQEEKEPVKETVN